MIDESSKLELSMFIKSFENTLLLKKVYSAPINHFFSLPTPNPIFVLDGIVKSVLAKPTDSKSTVISLIGNSKPLLEFITTDAKTLLFLELRLYSGE